MRDDSSVLVRITPYPKAEYEDNTESLDSYYDEVEVCQESCSAHFKAAITIKNIIKRGDEQNRHLVLLFYKPIAFLFCLSIITLWDFKSHIETVVLI